jgi:hypothetical protein
MSKRLEILILVALAILCGSAFIAVYERTAQPMIASGAQVTGSGWLSLLLSALGAGGFSVASLTAIVRNWAQLIPSAPLRRVAVDAVDVGQLEAYREIYSKTTDETEKAKLREAAVISWQKTFDEWFPLQ